MTNPPRARPRVRTSRRPAAVALAVSMLALGACDFPTEIPKWDTLWVVPGENTTIAVSSLLPSGVTVAAGGTAFQLSLPAASVSRTLGDICGEVCNAVAGLTAPKPEFTATLSASTALPADVVSATLSGVQVQVRITQSFGFDPLRPGVAAAPGFLVITATHGTTVLARDSISGESTAFASGSTLTRTLTLATATISEPIQIGVRLFSPAGDLVQVDPRGAISLVAQPLGTVQLTQVTIRAQNRTFTGASAELDLADVDQAIIDRVKGGALLLDVTNPFSVTGPITVTLTAPGVTISKPVQLQAGTFATRVALTGDELRSLLGKSPVRISTSGTVTGTGGTVTVTPSQSVSIRSRVELTIGPRED